MKQENAVGADRVNGGLRPSRLALVGSPLVFAAYAITIALARDLPLVFAVGGSVANTIPTVLFGLVAYRIVGRWLVGRPVLGQIAGHAVFSITYAALTYWLLLVLLGVVNSASILHFNVQPFPGRTSLWQLLQNITVYAFIAALAYIRPSAAPVTVVFEPGSSEPVRALSRYFIRSGDAIQPIDVDAIVSIAGADDYAEVRTLDGSHLVRLTLGELEKSLDPARFIRVHRSRIVNVERITRAEPAGGGRILLHMEDGETITASRSGSKALRERVL